MTILNDEKACPKSGWRSAACASLLPLIAALAGCAAPYDFRDEHRPEFQNRVTVEQAASMVQSGATLLDVRLVEDRDADPVMIPGAVYRDPERLNLWSSELDDITGPVVVYCVRGKWVSQKAASYLADRGVEVYSLDGGIEAWKANGRDTRPVDR